MSGILQGKVIIVTGAGRGVGAGIAKLAAAEGARVVVNDIGVSQAGDGGSLGPAEEVVADIRKAGGEAVADGNNVADWDGAHALVATAMKTFGDLNGVVNNAGILRDTIFHKMSPEEWEAVIKVNLSGVFNVSRAAAPHFKSTAQGSFVHMTSTSGLIGNFGQANYAAAKNGVAALSKSISLDMARFKVRSNCIAPFAYTRMVRDGIPDTPENAERHRVNSQMSPDKIAPFTCALLSEGAQDVSGQVFGVRRNEIFLFSQPRPIRSVHTAEGWTPSACLETVLPAFRASFYPPDRSSDVFTWDPI